MRDGDPAEAATATLGVGAPPETSGEHTFTPGSRIAGRYRIARFLAAGGMGEVYEAVDEELHERVALKTVRRMVEDAESRAAFKAELQLARRVTHPAVCRVHDLAFDGEVMFFTMEFLAGETLRERLAEKGRMAPREALPILRHIAAGIDAAHRAGVIHGDLKPGNVMLTTEGDGERVVVTDFGLARRRAAVAESVSGKLRGSPAYMAPEQLEARPLEAASDIYAFGVLLYQMVTGRLPFQSLTPSDTAMLRLSERAEPPRRYAPDLPRAWERVILRCLEREPTRRYARALDAVRALEPRSRLPWVLAAGVMAATAAVVVLAPGPPAAVSGRRASIAVEGFRNGSGRADGAWLSGALSEMLTTELAAGDLLRSVPRGTRADYVVDGSFAALDGGKVRLDARLVETRTGQTLALVGVDGEEGKLPDLVSRAGSRLRARLGLAALSESQAGQARASMPASPIAARHYAEGLARMRVREAAAAVESLRATIAAEPRFGPAYAALADAYWFLGREGEAREAASQAVELSERRAPSEKLLAEARLYETSGESARAAAIYERLWRDYPDEVEYGLRLGELYWRSGDAAATRRVLREVARMPGAADDPRKDLLQMRMADEDGERELSWTLAQRLLEKGRAAGVVPYVFYAVATQASLLWSRGRYAEAVAKAREAVRLGEELGDHHGATSMLAEVGLIELDRGRVAAADEAFAAMEPRGAEKRGLLATKLNGLGRVALARAEPDRARRLFEEAAADSEGTERRGFDFLQRAETALETGDLEGARRDLAQTIAGARERGWQGLVAHALTVLASVDREAGALAPARAQLEEALALWRDRQAPIEEMRVRLELGRVALAEGRREEAASIARLATTWFAFHGLTDDQALSAALLADATGVVVEDEVQTERPAVRLRLALSAARARGDSAKAAAAVAEAQKLGLKTIR